MSKSDMKQFTEIEVLGASALHDESDGSPLTAQDRNKDKGNDSKDSADDGKPDNEGTPSDNEKYSNNGKTSDSNKNRIWFLLLAASAIIISIVVYLVAGTRQSDDNELNALADLAIDKEESIIADSSAIKTLPEPPQWDIVITEESVNDVPMTLYSLQNLNAELIMGYPDMSDTTIVFATQAADIRKDNNEIVGDFVLRGQQLAKGKRKVGYCAIINNRTAIGMSDTDAAKDFCIENKGDYFRQYILVFDGEAQVNQLRGKALRRALANSGDSLYIITTHNRESLYDFSLALQDLGMTNALYLVGGDCRYAYRTKDSDSIFHNDTPVVDLPRMNYIIFRKPVNN